MSVLIQEGRPDHLPIRTCTTVDLTAVRQLAARDVLAGESPATVELFGRDHGDTDDVYALPGASPGEIRGAIRLSVRQFDGAGLIPWLHANEDFEVATHLLAFARERLGRRTLLAFTSPATSFGVPGLPVECRPATARALAWSGFAPYGVQQYLLRHLDAPVPPSTGAAPIARVTTPQAFEGWRLTVADDGTWVTASALLSRPDPGSGTAALLHLSVIPPHRRSGVGRRLLEQCLRVAADAGARRVATVIDPHNEAGSRLLTSQGFDHVTALAVHRRLP
ncbi:GNAT family N-acetyltransferase [Streptomyces heilongjiangensis]|uniref:GNAT family N-acetyltransferase n=1 Tax=Streptomyces heilongjiangensis TaxID=945052 RepID=A0ABW1AZD4_9ACTN|nr:GNAT family N-acetyltransferase [Streptomyces heilongjiangensis]MDC2947918.1 GNAT family N-acetyltransferase [Streptomyces heilongjiangensis]